MPEDALLYAEVGGKPIFKGLSLIISAGEVYAIIGPNGAGTSILGIAGMR